jgi:fibronectin type 3 domain-containing protein
MRALLVAMILLFGCKVGWSQRADTTLRELMVLARTSPDSIVLRWAPPRASDWLKANRSGYRLERFTVLRDGKLLPTVEREILLPGVLLPLPLDGWEPLVPRDKYAAIAAQALHGDSFELTTDNQSVFAIANKVKENDQRYGVALLTADMSPRVAQALALRWVDRQVKKNEKYLYRIISVTGVDTLRGSAFVAPEVQTLPRPLEFTASFKGSNVLLQWNRWLHRGTYTAYVVERAVRGGDFVRLHEEPLVTLAAEEQRELRHQYATDSVPHDGKEYVYRIRGLTPFGELGPPSEEASGRATLDPDDTPHITSAESRDNVRIELLWEYPVEAEPGLKGFDVRRSGGPGTPYQTLLAKPLPASARTFVDEAPLHFNYYQIVAITQADRQLVSHVHLAQLVDSVPPLPPRGLRGEIRADGRVYVAWLPNKEADIFGYRVYRGNLAREEFAQVTVEPTAEAVWNDSVSLKTLNRHLFYQVMAIDRSQNHSELSAVLRLAIPDQVKPVPPVFLPPQASREGVALHWVRSGSEDVKRYEVYHLADNDEWKKLSELPRKGMDTAYTYLDREGPEGRSRVYTVVAVDSAGLVSDPAVPIQAGKILTAVKPPVKIKDDVDRTGKRIRLSWQYDEPGVAKYQVYRAREDEPLKLWATLEGNAFEDKQVVMNTRYTYRVMAVFRSGARSAMSDEVSIKY